ncbi:hypothetical protein J5N97_025017 [Dioscorea zingiberensis]|uniref:Uncharacterized protein n=1 Tax=Dioscorea zingiberensis TaxID=325984 RepID=A0A9D5H9H2_9LILI|nr:hypothetical protein J5N97_025017 [Dioscorea zingiberensis]
MFNFPSALPHWPGREEIQAYTACSLILNVSNHWERGLSVIISPAPDYQIPPHAALIPTMDAEKDTTVSSESAVQKAEDVVSSMLAKGFVLGKDTLSKAKTFDEKLKITSTATSTVSSFDKKIGLSEKITAGTSSVTEKVKETDQRFQVSKKTKSAFAAQTVSSEGSAILKNSCAYHVDVIAEHSTDKL